MRYSIMQYEPYHSHLRYVMTDAIEQKTIGYRKDYTIKLNAGLGFLISILWNSPLGMVYRLLQ